MIVVLDAPSNLGLRPPAPGLEPGCRRMADALRTCGLPDRLEAEDAGRVEPPPYSPERDPRTGLLNAAGIAEYTVTLADRVAALLDGPKLPVLLGGDCSILLGPMLAMRRAGTYGLVAIDGSVDFRHPGNSAKVGAVAGEALAVGTGRGHPALTDLEGRRPYVRDEHVVALGHRSDLREYAPDIPDSAITEYDVSAIRRLGPEAVAAGAVGYLAAQGVDGFWLHVDVDSLDPAVMPAVDAPDPDGLSFGELISIVQVLVTSPLAAGAQFVIFDPDLDPDGRLAAELTEAIATALRPRTDR